MELNLHATVLVGVDFLPRRTNDDRRLAALHAWFWRHTRRSERDALGDTFERIRIEEPFITPARTIRLPNRRLMIDRGQHPFLVHVLAVVIGHFHQRSRGEAPAIGLAADAALEGESFLKAGLRQLITLTFLGVDSWEVVDFVFALLLDRYHEIRAGHFKVVIGVSPGAGAVFLFDAPLADRILAPPPTGSEIATHFRLSGAGFVGGGIVGKDKRVFRASRVMLEEV